MNISKTLLFASVATTLASCGGDAVTSALRQFAAQPTDVMLGAFDGRQLPGRSVVLRDDTASGAVNKIDVETSYSYDAASQKLTMTVGDITRTLDLSGADANVTVNNNFAETSFPQFAVFQVWGNTLTEFFTGTSTAQFLIPLGTYTENENLTFIDRSYAIVGRETPSTALQALTSTATYSGAFVVENYTQFDTSFNDRHNLYGNLTLNVDFGTDTLTSGQLNLTSDALGQDPTIARSGSLSVQSTSLDLANNSFETGLVSTAPGLTLEPGSVFTGGFYGDTGQEIGGTIYYKGILDGKNVAGGGVYDGAKN